MFKMIARMAVGGAEYEMQVEGQEEMEVLHKAIVLSNPRKKCDACGNYDRAKFKLDSNKDKEGNTYVNNVCTACGAKSKLGQYKTKGYFWREFEKYNPSSTEDAERALR